MIEHPFHHYYKTKDVRKRVTKLDFYFLGTGAAVPSRLRNVYSLAVCFPEDRSETWLFDCGEGTQHQILHTSIKPTKIRKIFITHLHGDHLFGLPGLLSTRSVLGTDTSLTVYGPVGIEKYLKTSLQTSQSRLNFPLEIVEITDDMELRVDQNRIWIAKLEHGIPSYGFRIERPSRPGNLDKDRLVQLGIPPGPIYQELKSGKMVQLEDGRIIDGSQFLSPEKKGAIFTILGDTRPTEAAIRLAQQADLLVHEATFRQGLADKAQKHYHSTTVEAAQIAKKARVKKLILTHISNRYQEEDTTHLRNEARTIFPNTEIAKDLWKFSIDQ